MVSQWRTQKAERPAASTPQAMAPGLAPLASGEHEAGEHRNALLQKAQPGLDLRMLRTAELELERKDAELNILRASSASGGLEALREELGALTCENNALLEQKQARAEEKQLLELQARELEGRAAELELRLARGQRAARRPPPSRTPGMDGGARGSESSSPSSPSGWRGKAAMLEEELKAKAEVVARLRQRELWFEQQLARQKEANGRPLEALLLELRGLQEASDRLTLQAAERCLSPHRSAVSRQLFPTIARNGIGAAMPVGATLPEAPSAHARAGQIVLKAANAMLLPPEAPPVYCQLPESCTSIGGEQRPTKRQWTYQQYPSFGTDVHVA